MIADLKPISAAGFLITKPGFAYYFFFGFFAIATSEVIFQIFRGIIGKVGLERRQFQYLAAANLLAIAAGFEYFFSVFGFFDRPPLDDYILVFYVVILAIGVTRHQIYDVEAIVKALRRERLATLGLLASSVNHEIRTPLFLIKGTLENVLRDDRPSDFDEKTKAVFEKIYRHANQMSDVIARFNHLAKKMDSKKAEGGRASIEKVLENVLEMIWVVKGPKSIAIHKNFAAGLPDVLIHESELEEILLNLLTNAVQAIKHEGRIDMMAVKIGERIQLIIEDTGTGISEKQLHRIFEPFHTTKGQAGTGLGLYITKQILDRRGASISVKRKIPSGILFEIQFPIAGQPFSHLKT